jgi:transposase InsO family protein
LTATTLGYDPAGRLYEIAASVTTRFLYDPGSGSGAGGPQAIAEHDGANALLRRYGEAEENDRDGTRSFPPNGAGVDETLFTSLGQAKMALEAWRRDFNEVRPHSSIGWKAPAEHAADLATQARRAKALELCDGSAPWPVAPDVLEDINRQIPIGPG